MLAVIADGIRPTYPQSGANWTEFVAITNPIGGGNTLYNQPDLPCADSTAGYFRCIHGGEARRATLAGHSSCDGLTAADELQAFVWECDVAAGTATFFSRGLRPGVGLRELLDAEGFRDNRLIVSRDGVPVLATAPAAWWSNPVVPLPVNADPAAPPLSLRDAGTVFVLATSRATSGYNLDGDHLAVVTLGDAVLSWSGSATPSCNAVDGEASAGAAFKSLLCSGTQSFLWIEARLDGGVGPIMSPAFYTRNATFLRVHRSAFVDAHDGGATPNAAVGVSLRDCVSSLVSESAAIASWEGFSLTGGHDVILQNLRAARNGRCGICLRTDATGHTVIASLASGGQTGLNLENGAHDNTVVQLSILGTELGGLASSYGARANTVHLVTSVNSAQWRSGMQLRAAFVDNTLSGVVAAGSTLGVELADQASGNRVYDLVAANNDGNGIRLALGTGEVVNNEFLGRLWVGANLLGDCQVDAGLTGNLLDNSCAFGPSLVGVPVPGVSTVDSFVGRVLRDDTVNRADNGGGAEFAAISDWLGFESPFRAWGREGASLFALESRGECAASRSCRIFDLRLRATDTRLRAVNGVLAAGAACPASVDAARPENVLTDRQAVPHTYLRNAFELVGDYRGNENGLCESNEACVFAPNLGAYQGEGDSLSGPCLFNGGNGVSGVTLYAYRTNGVPE